MNDTFLEFCGSVFISLLVWFFGIPDGFFKLLIALSVIDYLSGTFLAWRFHKLSSRIGFEGILRKCLMFTFVGIANLLDTYIGEALGTGAITRIVVSCFYISNEGISIIENAIDAKAPVPEGFKDWFLSWCNKKVISEQFNNQHEEPN